MNQEYFWHELSALPTDAQRQVLDFIRFLRSRYTQSNSGDIYTSTDLQQEPFIGMWADRNEMNDSSAWVRKLRQHEWG